MIETVKRWALQASLGELNELYKVVSELREDAITEALYADDEDEPYWNK